MLEQSVRLPPGGAVTGWAALRMHGGAFFDGLEQDGRTVQRVPLAIGTSGSLKSDRLIEVSREPLDPSEVVQRQGVPCTDVRRALFDEMRRTARLRDAVVAADMAAAAMLVSVRRMSAYLDERRSCRRASVARSALELASEHSRSPQESRTRLIWQLDAGLPPPLVNQHVWDRSGRLLAIVDLLDEEAGVVAEFDGADHRNAVRHTDDIGRQERLERHGLEVVRITGLDLLAPDRVVSRLHFHRSRARFLPPSSRSWTIVPPAGWDVPETLDEYLDERDFRRQLYEQYERETKEKRSAPAS